MTVRILKSGRYLTLSAGDGQAVRVGTAVAMRARSSRRLHVPPKNFWALMEDSQPNLIARRYPTGTVWADGVNAEIEQ